MSPAEAPAPWPDGYQSAVALTFDLDAETPWLADGIAVTGRPGLLSMAHYGPRVAVPLILAMLEQIDVPATFFVPGQSAELHRGAVEAIAAAGHEIAAHGYTHESPSSLSREREEADLEKTLSILGEFESDVAGYRAPFFEPSEHTVDLLDRHGLRYSSSMMGALRPYRHDGTGVIELPGQWLMDDWSQFGHGFGDSLARNATCHHVRQLWLEEYEALHRLGGLFVLTMHPQVIGRPARLEMVSGLVAEMRRSDGVWITDCRTMADHAAAAV
jgi:peptidoglycan/xylan/chitin deacetylase (PgdA/CDA1 family)